MSHLNFSILALFTNFGPIKIDLSGLAWLAMLLFNETFSVIFKHRVFYSVENQCLQL